MRLTHLTLQKHSQHVFGYVVHDIFLKYFFKKIY
jgi:hypothetical protein